MDDPEKGVYMHHLPRVLTISVLCLFLVGASQINAQADSNRAVEPSEQPRLVVFEAFMRPT